MAPINVTKPQLPPLSDLVPLLEDIWESGVVTNCGPYHERFENKLKKYLGIKNISIFNNATIGLLATIKALDLKGEVITSPYSFVATSHALTWNSITPVFSDISTHDFNICPATIERLITEKTSAILAVHCYGSPCNVDELERIADKYKIKLVFDAAHAFGIKVKGKSIGEFGDASVLSFHGTKVFNTFEGGAVICPNRKLVEKINRLKNFGFSSEVDVDEVGINGKMSEFNAALGCIQLDYIDNFILKRKSIYQHYIDRLRDLPGILIPFDGVRQDQIQNYSYFPIRVTSESLLTRDELYTQLKTRGINTRRYFYPIIPNFSVYHSLYLTEKEKFRNAKKLADEVLCLPIYPSLERGDIDRVVGAMCDLLCTNIESTT
jgi:dTDP-4-amino-4,6-dideoxygalactose transaminase